MQPLEQLRFVGFVAVVALVFYLAGSTLVRLVVARVKRQPLPAGRWRVWYRRVVLSLGALGVGCVAYGFLVEPYWLAVSHVRIASAKLAPGARAIRIAHISDLHCDPQARLENRLPAAIAAERPDLIVFTGDALNSPAGLPNFQRCMTRLAKVAPTFAVRGNWDVWYLPDIDLYRGTGVELLNGKPAHVDAGATRVWVTGLAVDNESQLAEALAAVPAGGFHVFLHHYPDEILNVAGRGGVDLYCAGHTHGGQVALPFYGALLTLSRFGKRFEAGLYHVGQTWLYVSRGIGMEGGRMPRVRFWARPEVTLIEVEPAQAR